MNKYPYLQIGLPLSGSAFHLPYCGVSLPTQFTKKWIPLSVHGGVGFMKQTFPKTLAAGATSNTAAFNVDLTLALGFDDTGEGMELRNLYFVIRDAVRFVHKKAEQFIPSCRKPLRTS
jgi:hypothetical protein